MVYAGESGNMNPTIHSKTTDPSPRESKLSHSFGIGQHPMVTLPPAATWADA